MSGRFNNKKVMIIGGGRGMGKAVAESFAEEGASLIISARSTSHGEQTLADFVARGFEASLVLGDISDRDSVRSMITEAASRYGGLDIVVQVAADNALGLVEEMEDEKFDYLIKSNVYSMFWVSKYSVPHLEKAKEKGRLIFISSAMANRSFTPTLTPYTSTKAFMNSFARGLALELGKKNILVNVVEPGMIASDRLSEHLTPQQAQALTSGLPIPRPGQPSEIADAVLFLASNQASYITGAGLLVDGGVSLSGIPDLSSSIR